MSRFMIEIFGTNTIKGKEAGLTAKEVCEMNVITATTFFGFTEEEAINIVKIWTKHCKNYNIFK